MGIGINGYVGNLVQNQLVVDGQGAVGFRMEFIPIIEDTQFKFVEGLEIV